MKTCIQLLLIAFVIFGTSSCKDKKYPTINILTPVEDSYYQAGQQYTVHAELTDDRGIISHRYYFGNENGVPDPNFTDYATTNLKKKEKKQTIKVTTSVPNLTGTFYLHIEVTDDTGKTSKQSRRFYITQ